MIWYAVLNSFMQAKQDRLRKFSDSPYWAKEDMQAVKEDFTETDIKNFFRRLDAIICNDAPCGLSVTTCPYCYRFERVFVRKGKDTAFAPMTILTTMT